jgi:hypothetical protein
MWVLKVNLSFKPKAFVVMLVVCAALAGVAAWVTGLNFWIIGVITVAAVLINGVIASVEDKDTSQKRRGEPPE